MLFQLDFPKMMAIQDEASTSVAADYAELSEGSEPGPDSEEEPDEPSDTEAGVEGEEAPEPVDTEEEEKAPEVFHPFARPSIKEVTEAFPEIFKKFPSLRDMYFREAEYSKILPTIEDAKEAAENSENYNTIRNDIFEGNGSKLFSGIRDADEKALDTFSTTILPTLFQVRPQAFWSAANPLIEDVARNMYQKGTREGDDNLKNAALHLSQYFFGTVEIAEGKRTSIKLKEPEDNKVKDEKEAWDQEKYQDFRGGIERDVHKQLVDLINEKHPKTDKSRLDPDGVFSKFIRDTIIEKIINDLGEQLTADQNHIKFMDSLWDKAKRNGRTDSDKARIMSAYLARAKSLIPTLRSKYVSEALGQNVRRSLKSKDINEKATTRVDSAAGRPSSGHRNGYNPRNINYSKTSDLDILNDDITYK